jgi:hypothetical protein
MGSRQSGPESETRCGMGATPASSNPVAREPQLAMHLFSTTRHCSCNRMAGNHLPTFAKFPMKRSSFCLGGRARQHLVEY